MQATQRTTIYLKRKVYRALKIKAAATDQGISNLVNDAVEQSLKEDAIDREAYRKTRGEPAIPFKQVLRELKRDGLL